MKEALPEVGWEGGSEGILITKGICNATFNQEKKLTALDAIKTYYCAAAAAVVVAVAAAESLLAGQLRTAQREDCRSHNLCASIQ